MKNHKLFRCHILLTTSFSLLFNLALLNAQTVVITDISVKFLTDYKGNLKVAQVPPAIDFGIIDIGTADPTLDYTHWGNIVTGPDGQFYYAIGDHNESGTEGTVILKSYNRKTQTDKICVYSPDVPGLADGKWHGRPTIDPATGDMFLIGFYGGQIAKYNIYSKEVTNYGKIGGHGWEDHIWDYKRNRLYGVGKGDLLIYDTENNTELFSDKPFPDFETDPRARMVDIETGNFYASANEGKLYKYNPDSNIFTKLSSSLPADLRANTNEKTADGSFWISDNTGNLFKFFPDKDSLVLKGVNGETGEYATFIEQSPFGNYLYYIAETGGRHLIQYNTNSDEKKVIAQITDFYLEKYNYNIYGFYGGALSSDGSSILLICNGRVGNGKKRPALFLVQIPQSEKDLETYIKKNPANIAEISAYPNPVKHSTTISFYAYKPGNASLTIMDITGKTIHTILHGYLPEGSHQFEWEVDKAIGLSRGIYFYSLQLNDERVVKKLIIL